MQISFFFILYRLATIFFEPLRFLLLFTTVTHKDDEDLKKSVKYVMSKCYLADWFVLYQLASNVNMYFMRSFMKELKYELKERPKHSKHAKEKVIYLGHL